LITWAKNEGGFRDRWLIVEDGDPQSNKKGEQAGEPWC
jgi:hypothetical protein